PAGSNKKTHSVNLPKECIPLSIQYPWAQSRKLLHKKQKKETVKDNYAQFSAIPASKIRVVGYTEQP
ncbi:hypothetical protein L873DRAFT_1798172, partial [Choiromyces venosus 120613-1]